MSSKARRSRVAAIRNELAALLGSARRRRDTTPGEGPAVGLLLEVEADTFQTWEAFLALTRTQDSTDAAWKQAWWWLPMAHSLNSGNWPVSIPGSGTMAMSPPWQR